MYYSLHDTINLNNEFHFVKNYKINYDSGIDLFIL